jgi:hypothetical protein
VLRLRSVQTCRRHYPGGIVSGAVARYPPRCQPSPFGSRFGSRINIFEACSAFTHVTACLFAGSPEATLSTRGFDGFVTSTAAPIATGRSDPVAGRDLHPLDLSTFARRTTEECLSRGAFHFCSELPSTRVDAPRREPTLPALPVYLVFSRDFA